MSEFAIVGQAPGPQAPEDHPPLCGGRTGRRLVRVFGYDDRMNGLAGYVQLRERAEIVNVLDEYPGGEGKGDAFPMTQAKRRAVVLEEKFDDADYRHVFLMGKKVAAAFHAHDQYFFGTPTYNVCDVIYHTLPHPSPVNRRWNEDGFEEKVRSYVTRIVGEPNKPVTSASHEAH